MAWTQLKNAINSAIKANNNQEITGQVLNSILNTIVNSIGKYATFAGIATPGTNPGVFEGPVVFFANTAGIYPNFGNITVNANQIVALYNIDGSWESYEIANNTITTYRLADGAVTTEKLASTAISQAMIDAVNAETENRIIAISNEAQARAKADEQLNASIVTEKNRAKAAEEANANAIQSIKDNGAVETYFYLHGLKLTETTITFRVWSYLYIKDLNSSNYVRYIIKEGTYDLPTNSSTALYVSLDIKDENGYLIPTNSGNIRVDNLKSKCYLIGFVSSFDNKFVLSDAVSVYQANYAAIQAEITRAKAAEEANLAAIHANSNDISTEITRAKAAEELNLQAINILKKKTSKISKEVVEYEDDEIIIEDDNNQELLNFKNGKLRVQEIETQKLNLSSSFNTDINISSDDSITIENGRCCSFIEGGSYLIKGTGNATINVSFTNKTFADVSYGFMWSWNSQLIASLKVQGITIGKYDSGSPATYKLQGGTFQRINKHDSSSNAVFEVNSDSEETWSLLITKKAEKFVKPRVKPICIVYDGGRWQGQVYWEGELYKIWDLHRKLDIPYAVALYSYQMNPDSGTEYTCEEVRRDIESGLCEVIIRNAGVTKTTDLEYLETIESERSLLEVKSKATILAAHILNPLIYRCSIKDGADFIRQHPFNDANGIIAYKYSDSQYKSIHSSGIPISLIESSNFWLPQIYWSHGVGIPPEGDIYSNMYGDTTGENTQNGFRNILSLAENGKVQILHPSDFSQYCKNIK